MAVSRNSGTMIESASITIDHVAGVDVGEQRGQRLVEAAGLLVRVVDAW